MDTGTLVRICHLKNGTGSFRPRTQSRSSPALHAPEEGTAIAGRNNHRLYGLPGVFRGGCPLGRFKPVSKPRRQGNPHSHSPRPLPRSLQVFGASEVGLGSDSSN
jgi:hypothetical protein